MNDLQRMINLPKPDKPLGSRAPRPGHPQAVVDHCFRSMTRIIAAIKSRAACPNPRDELFIKGRLD